MLIAAVAVTAGAFGLLAQTASKPKLTLLYAGLDARSAGDVVSALERMDVPYEIRGEAIYAPAGKRDSIRMSLAAQGLPQQGQAGYELLDRLSGFSTTSDMFDATYWRAKEGELARTILATPGVRAARVHIAQRSQGPFARNANRPTAVVTVTANASLAAAHAESIRFLVASAVPGLDVEQVAVIDSARGVLLSPGTGDSQVADARTTLDREQRLERDIVDLLEARVGPGNARAKVTLDIDLERESVSERIFNPDGRVVSGKETTEVSETTHGGARGVTVASNLPEGDAGGGASSKTERSETREVIRYDMSEVRREREKLPGAIRRMSVAVFINQIAEENADEPVLRGAEELEALKTLVASAAGLDEARGDVITIESMPFRRITEGGTLAEPDIVGDFMRDHLVTAIQSLVLSIVTIILGLFVVKPLLSGSGAPAPAGADNAGGAEATALAALPPPGGAASFPPASHDALVTLKALATERTDQTATLIKSWLESADDAA